MWFMNCWQVWSRTITKLKQHSLLPIILQLHFFRWGIDLCLSFQTTILLYIINNKLVFVKIRCYSTVDRRYKLYFPYCYFCIMIKFHLQICIYTKPTLQNTAFFIIQLIWTQTLHTVQLSIQNGFISIAKSI